MLGFPPHPPSVRVRRPRVSRHRASGPRVARQHRVAALFLLCLWGCAPEYDWRVINNSESGFTVMFPAKPTLDEHRIAVAGQVLIMRMQAAKAGDAVFAVGVVTLPSEDPKLQSTVLTYLETGLARNVGATPDVHPVRIHTGEPAQSVDGYEFSAHGKVRDEKKERQVRARFAVRGRRVFQAVIIGERVPPEDQVDQFLSSWKLY